MDLQKCIQTLHKHLNHPTEQVAIKTGYSWTRVWRIEHSKAGDGLYVHLEQRDYTGLFLPFKLMALDKKVHDGSLRLVLLRAIGQAVVTADYDNDDLMRMLERDCIAGE